MAATEQQIAPFEVAKVRPPLVRRGKSNQQLVRAGKLNVSVQVVSSDSGETNLHAHPGLDSAWLVMSGKAKFYTVNDRPIGDLEKNEVISIPAGTPYWFEAEGEEPLVILHITSRDPNHQGSTRIDYTPRDVGGENRVHDLTGTFFEG
jgi:mannose-6-phosphate isomerase-like protein (cupin superfamily)